MSFEKTVLITGASGVTSRSVARSLKKSRYFDNVRFIGTDICENQYGVYEGLFERLYKVPRATNPKYRSVMSTIIKDEGVSAALIMAELEMLYWCENPFKDVEFLSLPKEFAKLVTSKKTLYETLNDSGLVPKFQILSRDQILKNRNLIDLKYPFWIRDYQQGTTSGKGSFLAESYDELTAWLTINKTITSYMLSEYLSGKNYGCFLLFYQGSLVKAGLAERQKYFMSNISISGVTGNASVGRLSSNTKVIDRAERAVKEVCETTGEKMNGLVVVDMKGDDNDEAFVTEINIKHAAITSTLANGGCNMAEYQLLCTLGMASKISGPIVHQFSETNKFFRDIDGLPIYIDDYTDMRIGEFR